MSNTWVRSAAPLLLLFAVSDVVAVDYCVSDSSGLQAAFTAAVNSPDAVANIKIVTGDYAGNFVYATPVADQQTPAMIVSGGWTAGCTSQTEEQSHIGGNLTLTGANYAWYPVDIRQLFVSGKIATVTFGRVSIDRSRSDNGVNVGCCASGLSVLHSKFLGSDARFSVANEFAPGEVSIRDNVFAGTLSDFYFFTEADDGSRQVVEGNTYAFATGGSWKYFDIYVDHESVFLQFSRNLITFTPDTTTVKFGFNLDGDSNYLSAPSSVSNNWLAAPSIATVTVTPVDLFNGNGNNVGDFVLPYRNAAVPQDLHLRDGSPMIDYSEPESGDDVDTDVEGRPRVQGGLVDVGAYETMGDDIFWDGFGGG